MPLPVRLGLDTTLAATRAHRSMTLALCLSYGGREEIVHAARVLAQQVAKGELRPDDIDEARFEQQLWTAPLASPPDLIIRHEVAEHAQRLQTRRLGGVPQHRDRR